MFLLQAKGFKSGNDTDDAHLDFPYCSLPVAMEIGGWVQWNKCQGEKGRVLLNTSYGSIIKDGSSKGSARTKTQGRELRWQAEYNQTYLCNP